MTEQLLRIPEVARRLNLEGAAVYHFIARRELEAVRGEDGLVYVTADALHRFRTQRDTATS